MRRLFPGAEAFPTPKPERLMQRIDSVAARVDGEALREAQSHKDAVRAYEFVYAALAA